MGKHYLIAWHNPDARGWTDLLEENALLVKGNRRGRSHLTFGPNGDVLEAYYDLEIEPGGSVLLRYGERNPVDGAYRGEMRVHPAKLLGTTTIDWRDPDESEFEALPVTVTLDEADEGSRTASKSTRLKRSSKLAIMKRARCSGCEACGFAGRPGYEKSDRTWLEVHHRKPLAAGKRVTTLDDLVCLCANCHRVLHALDVSLEAFIQRLRKVAANALP